jgi:hypothetical protein
MLKLSVRCLINVFMNFPVNIFYFDENLNWVYEKKEKFFMLSFALYKISKAK